MSVIYAAVHHLAITDQVFRKQNFYRLRIHYINVTVYGEVTRVLVEIRGIENVM